MYKQEKIYYRKAFLTALIMGAVLLLPFVVIDGGYFIFYGDYNAQQIPFYKTCINALRDGNTGWNWQTDLGANFVGSYSFYTLGSPFFWFAAMFPVGWSQYLMAPLLAVKLGLASLFAYMYIRRFTSKPQSALIGGLLYAFSGFSMYNIFFNHFHEAIVFFPLLLIGLEEAVLNKRRGFFALTVALNAFVNYFFFIGECVFLVVYFLTRFLMDKDFRPGLKGFACLAFESVAGVMLAGILFVPSIFQVLDVPRSTNMLTDWGFLFYKSEQRYGLILQSMFFPPDVSARNSMFSEANAKWSSVALYLPLFSMAGVIAFVKDAKGHWARVLLPVCLAMAMVPGLNSAFVLFNNNFYTRWFYMPELICCMATVIALEKPDTINLKIGFKACAVTVGTMAVLALFAPFTKTEEITAADGTKEKVSSVMPRFLADEDMSPSVWITPLLAAAFLVVLYLVIVRRGQLKRAEFTKRVTTVTMICCLMLGYYFVGYGRILGPYVGDYNKTVSADIQIDDTSFYRIEAPDEINNANMLWGKSSLKSFTSIIPSSTFEFYDLLGIERSVNSAPDNDKYALRALTRVKYVILPQDMSEKRRDEILDDMKIYSYDKSCGEWDVYSTSLALPMGFSYDHYVTEKTMKSSSDKDKLMIRAVTLTDEQAEKYSDILTKLDSGSVGMNSYDVFQKDALERIISGVSDFTVTKTGFTAKSEYDTDKLVVFSVPYDNGWSARIDGENAEIEKVNGGLMGLRVPAGKREIAFTYSTPGFTLGVIFTIVGAVLIAAYILVFRFVLRERPSLYKHMYKLSVHDGVKAHVSYIAQLSKQINDCPERSGNTPEQDMDYRLVWPDIEEAFMDRKKYDFGSERDMAHLSEHDEAYMVLKELEEQKESDSELK